MAETGDPLSERELVVLDRLVDGSTNREIARDLSISPNTVKVHLRNIFTKLDVSSRTEAATLALQDGLLAGPVKEDTQSNQAIDQEDDNQSLDRETLESQEPSLAEAQGPNVFRNWQSWRIAAVVLVVIVALLSGILISSRLLGENGQTSIGDVETAEATFIEEQIEGTNWLRGRSLPRARADMAVATIGLDLFQIGGEVEAGVVNLVDIFDTDNKEWRSASSKPTAVADANAAVLFGEIYVPGGRLADGNPTAVVEAYSPSNDAWRPVAPLPTPLAGSVVISHGDLLYVFGGWDGAEFQSKGFAYDPSTNEWRSLSSMKTSRAYASGAALASQLFVLGGFDGENELDSCEYFDISEESWFSCPVMIDPRAGAGAAVLGNKLLYIIGGGLDGSVATGEVYDAASGNWEPINMPMIEAGSSWYDLGVTNLESRIYVLGGRQDGELVDSSYIYAPLIHQLFLPAVGTD